MNSRVNLIDKTITYINSLTQQKVGYNLPNCQPNYLEIDRDSLGFMILDQVQENLDVTGNIVGNLPVDLTYRKIQSNTSSDEITSLDLLENIVSNLIKDYKLITGTDFVVFGISEVQTARLNAVYDDNTKDFTVTIKLDYMRNM